MGRGVLADGATRAGACGSSRARSSPILPVSRWAMDGAQAKLIPDPDAPANTKSAVRNCSYLWHWARAR